VDKVPIPSHDHDREPQSGGGLVSDPASGAMGADTRPEFNPAFLVHEVERLLREHRVPVDLDPARRPVAEIAAADLLRALGVAPASAPGRH
jgi:hypothetical protein